MVDQRRGLIVNISSPGAQAKVSLLPDGVAKAALDRMTADMAAELADRGVAVLAVWPPPTATEGMLASVDEGDDPSKWSSPIFTGRVVAALAAHANVIVKTGSAFQVTSLALELGIEDTAEPNS